MDRSSFGKALFLEAYESAADAIFRYCFLKTGDRALAEDLLQETFRKVWQFLAEGGEVKNVKALLFATARNLVVDEYRKNKPQSLDNLHEEQGFDPASGDGKESIERAAEGRLVYEAISRLPMSDQDILRLRFADDLSIEEISEVVSISRNAVSVRLNRVLNKLRVLLRLGDKHGQ